MLALLTLTYWHHQGLIHYDSNILAGIARRCLAQSHPVIFCEAVLGF